MSAFAFGGVPGEVVREVVRATRVYVSPALLDEYRDIPRELVRRGKITRSQRRALLSGIAAFVASARLVMPKEVIRLSRDPDDDVVITCCAEAEADFLITGDRDLLDIAAAALASVGLKRLRIVSPRAFLDR